MSRLGVGIGFGPQKEDSMSIVCGEPDLSPEEEEEMEETLVSPGGNHGDDDDGGPLICGMDTHGMCHRCPK